MENSMAKDVITQMYAEFKLYHHYTVENWGILCSALGCAVEALEKQMPQKVKYGYDDQDDIKCSNCDYAVGRRGSYFGRSKYCEECGQRLDWSDTE